MLTLFVLMKSMADPRFLKLREFHIHRLGLFLLFVLQVLQSLQSSLHLLDMVLRLLPVVLSLIHVVTFSFRLDFVRIHRQRPESPLKTEVWIRFLTLSRDHRSIISFLALLDSDRLLLPTSPNFETSIRIRRSPVRDRLLPLLRTSIRVCWISDCHLQRRERHS